MQTKREGKYSRNVWIISQGRYTDFDLREISQGMKSGAVKEYKISDLARYLLNPNAIEVKNKLVGCEIHYRQAASDNLKEKVRQILPQKLKGLLKDGSIPPEVIISDSRLKPARLKDRNLALHFEKIYSLLRPYDSVIKRLERLDVSNIADILGICEDIGGNRLGLNIRGNLYEKIQFVNNFLLQDVGVILEKAYVSNGLFELRGFDFKSWDPKNFHRLIKFNRDGKPAACVLGSDDKVDYWIDDIKLVHYMHLLEQSIKTNSKLDDSFNLCTKGEAKPLKLFFNKQLEIDYSKAHPPEIYKTVFDMCNVGSSERDIIMSSLNKMQLGISFNYIPRSSSGEVKLFTSISVMHNMRALEPIKNDFPRLYSEIHKRASVSEVGWYYLLEAIREVQK